MVTRRGDNMTVLEYVQVLERLRKAWHGQKEAQDEINKVLTRLHSIM